MCRITAVLVVLVALLAPVRSHALFHITQIDEVMSGVAGNPNLQYVQIRMLAGAQTRRREERSISYTNRWSPSAYPSRPR